MRQLGSGTLVRHYRLADRLGHGAVGEVWSGVDERSGERVAVKLVFAGAAKPRALTEFRREIEALAGLHHPAIVRILDFGTLDTDERDLPFVVTDLGEGTLADLMSGDLAWSDVKGVLVDLLEGLAHAHARDVLHRDIKPQNILRAGRRWKLVDFGLAWRFQKERTAEVKLAGTLPYMGPEHFRGQWRDYGPPTDLYSLGVVAFELACGKRPFNEADVFAWARAHRHDQPAPFEPRFPVPDQFAEWVGTLLRKSPYERFRFAADALHALHELGEPTGGFKLRLGPLGETGFGDEAPTVVEDPTDVDDDWNGGALDRRKSPPPAPMPPTHRSAGDSSERGPTSLDLLGLRAVPCVGRRALRERLWESLRDVSETGTPAVTVLFGSSGVGKSHLARWFVERSRETGAALGLRVRYTESGGRDEGFLHSVARELGILGLRRGRVRSRVERYFAEQGGARARLIDSLSGLLLDSRGDGWSNAERFSAIIAWLRYETLQRPMVLWLDDAHWGEEAFGFIKYLLDLDGSIPVLVVATVQEEALAATPERAEALRTVTEHARGRREDVSPLSADESKELLDAVLPLSVSTRERLGERVAGNPFFAVQLLSDLAREGLLEWTSDGYVTGPLPQRLRTAGGYEAHRVAAFEDVLEPDDRTAWHVGAILGQIVNRDEWHAVCSRLDVTPGVDLVERAGRWRLARVQPDGWTFAHVLIRESVVDRLRDSEEWARLQLAAGTELQDAAERSDPRGRLARRAGRHFFDAGRYDLAAAAARPIVRRIGARMLGPSHVVAIHEALPSLELHNEACRRLGLPPHDADWLRGRLAHVRHQLSLMKSSDSVDPELDELEGLVAGSSELESRLSLARAIRTWGRPGDRVGWKAHAHEALRLARVSGNPELIRLTLCSYGDAAYYNGELDEALTCYHELQKLAAGVDPSQLAYAEYSIGYCLQAQGHPDAARPHLVEAVRAYRALRSLVEVGVFVALAEVDRDRGDYTAALDWLQKARAIAPYRTRNASIEANIAIVHELRGDAASAHTICEVLRDRLDEDALRRQPAYLLVLAIDELRLGHAVLARERLGHAVTAVGESNVERDGGMLFELFADRATEAGHDELVRLALQGAEETWERLGHEEDAARVRARLRSTRDR